MPSKGFRFTFTIAALLLSVPFCSPAAVINGSFETGNFTGWSTSGDTSTQTSAIGISPTDGKFMALLTTLCDETKGFCNTAPEIRELPYSGNNAFDGLGFLGYTEAELNDILASNPGRHFPLGESSAISQTVAAQAGDLLSFDFNIVTTEAILNADQVFFTLIPGGPGSKTLVFLNPLTGSGVRSDAVDLCHQQVFDFPDPCGISEFNRTTDWQHFTFAIPSAGTFTFGFGLWDSEEGPIPSALFIDRVRLESTMAEPGTAALLCVGAILLLISRKRGHFGSFSDTASPRSVPAMTIRL